MAVAVAPDAVRDAAQREEAVPVRRERLEDALEPEVGPGTVRPELRGDGAVRGKDDDQSLARARGRREAEARQAVDEGQQRGGQTGAAEERAAEDGVHRAAGVGGSKPWRAASVAILTIN